MNESEFHIALADLQTLADDIPSCGICGRASDLVLDHDHDSGFIRGFLCRPCNSREGFHPQCCEPYCDVCMWRRRPAASFLGLTYRYHGVGWRGSLTDPRVAVRDAWQPTVTHTESDRRRHAATAQRMDAYFDKLLGERSA